MEQFDTFQKEIDTIHGAIALLKRGSYVPITLKDINDNDPHRILRDTVPEMAFENFMFPTENHNALAMEALGEKVKNWITELFKKIADFFRALFKKISAMMTKTVAESSAKQDEKLSTEHKTMYETVASSMDFKVITRKDIDALWASASKVTAACKAASMTAMVDRMEDRVVFNGFAKDIVDGLQPFYPQAAYTVKHGFHFGEMKDIIVTDTLTNAGWTSMTKKARLAQYVKAMKELTALADHIVKEQDSARDHAILASSKEDTHEIALEFLAIAIVFYRTLGTEMALYATNITKMMNVLHAADREVGEIIIAQLKKEMRGGE